MEYLPLMDRAQIEAYLRSNPELFVYGLGDLEDDLWPFTKWYGAVVAGEIRAICLVFSKYKVPVVHAISEPGNEALSGLVAAVADRLPEFTEIHLGDVAEAALDGHYRYSDMVEHRKMSLRERGLLVAVDVSSVDQLDSNDVDAIRSLYDAVYANATKKNSFDSSMLDVGPYFGVRESGRLISAAGVHVFSPTYGVAAVANVATHPEHRGRGLASAVTARLCQELMPHVEHIGLNVAAGNEAALKAYGRIGFEVIARYREGFIRRRG
jgi:ribosomal protein S18 acetylase RimI-like enzyme